MCHCNSATVALLLVCVKIPAGWQHTFASDTAGQWHGWGWNKVNMFLSSIYFSCYERGVGMAQGCARDLKKIQNVAVAPQINADKNCISSSFRVILHATTEPAAWQLKDICK